MISHPKFNFVFVGVPKSATCSIRSRLFQLGAANENKQKYSAVEYPHAQHYNIREYRQILGDELDSRFKFAFVRNPWSKMVSSFTRECSTWRNSRMSKAWILDPKKFQQWVKLALDPKHINNPGYFRLVAEPQLNWLTDEHGKVAVDFIGRFENLASDLDTVLNKIDQIHSLPPRKLWTHRRCNVSQGATEHYSHYYDDETTEVIRKVYEKDIEYFGYTFEGAT